MDRTSEFKTLISPTQKTSIQREQKFYEELYDKLNKISEKTRRSSSYKALILLDQDITETIKKTTSILESIKISGNPDVKANFEGIKYILNHKMASVSKEITQAKNKLMNVTADLEPVKPQNTKKISENLLFEQENRNILETTQYEATKQRLLKIEAVQRAIQENLLIQDERIDNICISNSTTSSIYENLLGDNDLHNGSLVKRSAITIQLCLAFVLVFLHVYYRK